MEHDDRLAQLYLGKPGARFFGDAVPAGLAQTYVPVKVTIAPIHVRVGEPTPAASLRAEIWVALMKRREHTKSQDMPAPTLCLLLCPFLYRTRTATSWSGRSTVSYPP